jgi:CBS domain-containing protein
MRAHQIMTRPVFTVLPNATILEAATLMLRQHISGLPVVDAAGKLVGIISEGDFIRRSEIGTQRRRNRFLRFLLGPGQAADDFVHERGCKIAEVMTHDPVTISEDASLEAIVALMEKNKLKRLPVMRGEKLVGIVSRSNLMQAVASLARQVPDPTADDDHIRNRICAGSIRCRGFTSSHRKTRNSRRRARMGGEPQRAGQKTAKTTPCTVGIGPRTLQKHKI